MQNKKAQIYIIAFILVLALVAFFFLRMTSPDDGAVRADVTGNVIEEKLGSSGVMDPVDNSKSHISFEGFGPGKSHKGKFDEWNADLNIEDGNIVGFEGTIQTNSVNTGIGGLDTHLQAEDFFDATNNPTITFKSSSLEDGTLSGGLTFLGTYSLISFPVIITEDSISADFILDTTQFGEMNDKANKEVRIFFELFK